MDGVQAPVRVGERGGIVKPGAAGRPSASMRSKCVPAERSSRSVQIVEQDLLDPAWPGVCGSDEMIDKYRVFLAYAVETPGTLLKPDEAPRDIPIDHDVSSPQIDTLAASIRGDEDLVFARKKTTLKFVAALQRGLPVQQFCAEASV